MRNQKQTYLTLDERYVIEAELNDFHSFKTIAELLHRDPSVISREVKRNYTLSYLNQNQCDCTHFHHCHVKNLCNETNCRMYCCFCEKNICSKICEKYESNLCQKLSSPPYVCNSCKSSSRCRKAHHIYKAEKAQQIADARISTGRSGILMTPSELKDLDKLVSPLIKKGQPISHIYYAHEDEIGCSRKTLYNYIDAGLLSVKNIDLRRKVTYKQRKKRKSTITYRCRENRTYHDFQSFIAENPDLGVVQMDTVHGSTDKGPCLLTLLFTNCSLMLIFKLSSCTQKQVLKVFEMLYSTLGHDVFVKTFPVILTDNGNEFKDADGIENSADGLRRTRVFYCDPMASWQKGAIEKNHEFIRYVIKKGQPFRNYTDSDLKKLENHINNTARQNLNGQTPYALANLFLDRALLSSLNVTYISPDDVCLTEDLFKDKQIQ